LKEIAEVHRVEYAAQKVIEAKVEEKTCKEEEEEEKIRIPPTTLG